LGKVALILLLASSLYSAGIYETIFDGNCRACHNATIEDSAPFIHKVVKRYKTKYPKEKDFVSHLSNWVASPNVENSLFKEAIKHYGLMPELGIDKDTLKGIAKYLYRQNDSQDKK